MTRITLAMKAAEAHCGWHRYLQYHLGGAPPPAEGSVLLSDDQIWAGIASLCADLQMHDRLPTTPRMREIVSHAQAHYLADDSTTEQSVLLSGLLWAVRLNVLPWLHDRYRIVAVAPEWSLPLTEDTSLSLRCDLVAQPRRGGPLAVFQVEPVGYASSQWAEHWQTRPEIALPALGAKERWGHEVAEVYVLGLSKGLRTRTPDGTPAQQTPLCYGYRLPQGQTRSGEDWLPAREWQTADGETFTARKAYERAPVWEIADAEWPVWHAYSTQDPDMPCEEFWVRNLPASMLEKVTAMVGPMTPSDYPLDSLIDGWARAEGAFWEDLANMSPHWIIPRSWNCRPIGHAPCAYIPVCFNRQETP